MDKPTISFDCTAAESETISKIVRRAASLGLVKNNRSRLLDARMDLAATHCNGTPLRLSQLLDADNFNFAHDFLGIAQHLSRDTGQLQNRFRPRSAQRTTS
jgi:hypothetical protein